MKIRLLALMCVFGMSFGSTQAFASTTTDASVSGSGMGFSSLPATTSLSPLSISQDGSWMSSYSSDPMSLTFYDSRGTGDGFTVSVQSSQLTEVAPAGGFAVGTTPLQMPKGSLILYAPSSIIAEGSTNAAATPTITGVGYAAIDSTEYTLATADPGKGMGSFTMNFAAGAIELGLSPSEILVDDVNYSGVPTPYEAVLTWSINALP
ncbi:WxL domain-containing protein (plasmid) [Rossellomorea sp. AcN35-11]|nr:WxL domain-containing protein [Rossellomorea aquimaris]WJV31860.1 WxL domain-containing protein [Rossellomorea sp. AcN35-11]